MVVPRIAANELQASVTKTADFIGAEIDDLDHLIRGGVLLDVTAISGSSPVFQFVLFASVDGTNFFEIGSEGRTAFMAGGPDQTGFTLNSRRGTSKMLHLRSWIEE